MTSQSTPLAEPREDSLKDIETWIHEAKESAEPDVSIMVIGNKNDLVNQRKVIFSIMRLLTTKVWSCARS
jgi:GTPase SAR1 family protein